MKETLLFLRHRRADALGLAAGLAVLVSVSASGQSLLKNWDFEQPFGPTNWTVKYLHGGPDDWEITGRTRGGSMYSQATANPSRLFGGYLRILSLKLAHACFTQTVTNLTPGHVYNFAGNMKQDWWQNDDPKRNQYLVYIELIGGQGTPTEDGRFSMIATNDLTPDANIDAPYTYPTIIWRPFYTQQIPDTNRCIEVRMHYNKVGFSIYDKTWLSAASFDDFYLTP